MKGITVGLTSRRRSQQGQLSSEGGKKSHTSRLFYPENTRCKCITTKHLSFLCSQKQTLFSCTTSMTSTSSLSSIFPAQPLQPSPVGSSAVPISPATSRPDSGAAPASCCSQAPQATTSSAGSSPRPDGQHPSAGRLQKAWRGPAQPPPTRDEYQCQARRAGALRQPGELAVARVAAVPPQQEPRRAQTPIQSWCLFCVLRNRAGIAHPVTAAASGRSSRWATTRGRSGSAADSGRCVSRLRRFAANGDTGSGKPTRPCDSPWPAHS